MSRPHVRIAEDEPKPVHPCFFHAVPLPCPVCRKIAETTKEVKNLGLGIKDVICPECGATTKARLLLRRWSAVCEGCRHPFDLPG